jgi:hypothetical protein
MKLVDSRSPAPSSYEYPRARREIQRPFLVHMRSVSSTNPRHEVGR